MLRKYHIWDIDNCLADDQWRQHLIDWSKQGDDRYRAYNALMHQDALHERHHAVYRTFVEAKCCPIFFTGRSEQYRAATERWLTEKLYAVSPVVFMRPNGTVGLSPAKLKAQQLLRLRALDRHSDIVMAFDDVPAVVQMYRSHGIPAAELAIHSDLSAVYDSADLATV